MSGQKVKWHWVTGPMKPCPAPRGARSRGCSRPRPPCPPRGPRACAMHGEFDPGKAGVSHTQTLPADRWEPRAGHAPLLGSHPPGGEAKEGGHGVPHVLPPSPPLPLTASPAEVREQEALGAAQQGAAWRTEPGAQCPEWGTCHGQPTPWPAKHGRPPQTCGFPPLLLLLVPGGAWGDRGTLHRPKHTGAHTHTHNTPHSQRTYTQASHSHTHTHNTLTHHMHTHAPISHATLTHTHLSLQCVSSFRECL